MKKYLDLLIPQKKASDADLSRAFTVDDVIERVREGLTQMFEKKEAEMNNTSAL